MVAIFKINFNQEMYLIPKNTSESPIKITELALRDKDTGYPKITGLAQGIVDIVCDGVHLPNQIGKKCFRTYNDKSACASTSSSSSSQSQSMSSSRSNPSNTAAYPESTEGSGDSQETTQETTTTETETEEGEPADNKSPAWYLTSPPTIDAAGTMLNYIYDGAILQEPLFGNRYAIVYIVPEDQRSIFTSKQCSIQFRTDFPYTVGDKCGNTFDRTFSIPYQQPKCSFAEMKPIAEFADKILNFSSLITNPSQVIQLYSLINLMGSRESVKGCDALVQKFMTYREVNQTIEGTDECLYPFDDPRWKTDPCCNEALLTNQCCVAKDILAPVQVIDSVNSTKIGQICQNPLKIRGILANYAESLQDATQQPLKPRKLFDNLFKFVSTCEKAVFNKKCKTDTDCPFSGSCNRKQGMCSVDFTNPGPALVKCYVKFMRSEMRLELKTVLDLPTYYPTEAAEAAAISDAIIARASSVDCVGPSSEEFKTKVEWKVDPDTGNFKPVVTPGNFTGCLSVKKCSFEPWNRDTQSKCLADSTFGRTRFCGQCSGEFCEPITQFASCTSYIMSDAYCTEKGGVFDSEAGTCSFPNRNTASTCLVGPNCLPGDDPFRCMTFACISTTATNQVACNNLGGDFYWDETLNKCMIDGSSISYTDCKALGNTVYHAGVEFTEGKYDTLAKCPSKTCDNFEVLERGGGDQECLATGYCTTPCARCRSDSYDNGACRNTTATTQASCQKNSGKWITGLSQSGCITGDPMVNCTGPGLVWSDCNNLSESQCPNAEFSDLLSCSFSDFDSCKSEQKCLVGGFCNDDEFGKGSCIYQPESGELFDCGENAITTGGFCISTAETTKSACQNAGRTWKERATTKAECLANGAQCTLPDGFQNNMNSTACEACGGDFEPLYTWTEVYFN